MSNKNNDIKISKFISLVLRHKPEVIGAKTDNNGYISNSILINGIKRKFDIDFTLIDLERIVKEDDKQRYSFSKDGNKIRANQGHSINVDLELSPIKPPDILFHGTCTKVKELILKDGIKHMSRRYVHLSKDIDTATKVGKRHGELLIFSIDSKSMYNDGYKFYLSKNNVWLTDYVPIKYINIFK